ncbi:MAG: hypothetical protein ACRDQ1_21560, partial [Sciscionella sp.]
MTNLAGGITKGGTAFHTARSESESLWQGQAGDAFRGRMRPVGQRTDEIANHTHTAGQAINGFA